MPSGKTMFHSWRLSVDQGVLRLLETGQHGPMQRAGQFAATQFLAQIAAQVQRGEERPTSLTHFPLWHRKRDAPVERLLLSAEQVETKARRPCASALVSASRSSVTAGWTSAFPSAQLFNCTAYRQGILCSSLRCRQRAGCVGERNSRGQRLPFCQCTSQRPVEGIPSCRRIDRPDRIGWKTQRLRLANQQGPPFSKRDEHRADSACTQFPPGCLRIS